MAGREHDAAPRRKAGRLSRSAEFDRVYRHGRSVASRHLVLYTFPNDRGGEPRVGLSVGRRVGGAVERNRVKRLLREALASRSALLADGNDVVIVARPPLGELSRSRGLAGVEDALEELLRKSGGADRPREGAGAGGDGPTATDNAGDDRLELDFGGALSAEQTSDVSDTANDTGAARATSPQNAHLHE